MEKSIELMLKTYEKTSLFDLIEFVERAEKNELHTITITGGEQQYDTAGYETSVKNFTLIATA